MRDDDATDTGAQPRETPPVPELPGRPLLDVTDASATLALLDDEALSD